jgi:primary-amine oxidase
MNLHQRFVSFCSGKRMLINLAAVMFLVTQPVWPQSPQHPLDGLTAPEIWTAYEVLQASHKVGADTRFPMVQLHEPPKEEVLAWKPGQPMRREAFLVVKQGPQTFEAVVDVTGKKLVSWTEIKGVQPKLLDEEENGIDGAVKENAEIQAALKRRGINDLTTVFCYALPAGYFGTQSEVGRKLLRVRCDDERGTLVGTGMPIEGLTGLWDANEKKMLRVVDTGVVPVHPPASDYDAASVGPLREASAPLSVQQPVGPGFRLDGQSVSWDNWNFHFRIDRRVGLIVSNVGYKDGDRLRSILYEGSLSEVFAPYMDPSEGWFWKTPFDPGEGAEGFSDPLEPGADCPENAVYFDQIYASTTAMPQLRPRAACLFEQPAGYPAWRHGEQGGVVESRKLRELVLRTIVAFGNYDFIFDWIFQQNGTIRVRVGATGYDNVKGAKSRTAVEDKDGQDGLYGRFIAENMVAVNHDHFFSFRLDFDVDGTANSFVRDHLRVKRLPADSLRKSLWVAEPETAKTEEQAKVRMSMEEPEVWRVVNPNVKSPLGYPVGYELMGGDNAVSLLLPEDYPQKRAGFTDYHVWVTPYRENERYAAGDYPLDSIGGDGLPAWTKANRAIENTDIMLWYTVGFHHLARAEDWPVMPTVWHEFELRPVNSHAILR